MRSPTRQVWSAEVWSRVVAWLLFLGPPAALESAGADQGVKGEAFHVGFSAGMFSDISENDARAVIKAWGQTIAKGRQLPEIPDSVLFRNQKELVDALEQGRVDAVGITITEFDRVRDKVALSPVFVTAVVNRTTEQYLLLAQGDGKVRSLRDLAGVRFTLQRGPPRLSLAELWLEDLLRKEGLPNLVRLVGSAKAETKISRALLPVFFGNADACLVTRSGFDTMCELNPQIGKRLAVVASSDDWIPAVFALRADYRPSSREALIRGLRELHLSPSGRQVLTVFQSDRLEEADPAQLKETVEFIRRASGKGANEVPALPVGPGGSTGSSRQDVQARSLR